MAKKQKGELTPEEKAAKKLRHSNGWVRFWAIVVALALTDKIHIFDFFATDRPMRFRQLHSGDPS